MLDLGSELSPMPWFLASLGATVTLVGRDSQWLPAWEHLAKETGLKVDWRIVKGERLPFPARSFDLVTSFSVIEHQENKHLAINEIARVLKPEGIFAISFDVCEPDMGMTFPEWNGKALTMTAFEELIWENPAFDNGGKKPDWNIGDSDEFIKWHQESASHHNYEVGATVIQRRAEKPLKPDKINIRACRNILVPRFDTFGDIILLQGFIHALLDLLPEARITLLVREGYDQLKPLFPERLIWKTTRINPYKEPSDMGAIKSLLEELKEGSYDLLLITTYSRTWPDDLIAAALTSMWRIVLGEIRDTPAYLTEVLPDIGINVPDCVYDECIPVEEKTHETEKYQTLWKHITGQESPLPKPQLTVPDDAMKQAQDFLDAAGLKEDKFVFCFPAGVANVSLKAWPEDNFAEVITHLEKKYSLKTLVAAHESEKDIADKVIALATQRRATPELWLGKDGEIPLACALIAKCHFYLGNDTGMMHVAAALNKPVVAIFGGGTWPRFLPDIPIGFVLTQELPCTYCMWDSCWLADAPCIKMVSINNIVQAIDRLLKGMVYRLEVHKGLPLETDLKVLLEKGNNNFKKLEEEINKTSRRLSELHKIYEQVVNELKKRDASLTELRDVYHQAVDEIRKRDMLVSELKSANDNLTRINKQAMCVLPMVSIVTPVYNGAKWMEECIQSVLNQDYPKIEHIIVDGASTDGTLDICSRYPHLIVHSKRDRGQSHAINKGFAMAQGDILAWLCADDEYEPGAIQAAVKSIIAGNDIVMGYSRFIDADGNVTGEHPANIYDHFNHGMLLRFWKYGTISQPATFWTRNVWEICGPVRENLFFAMDYDLWLRMSQKTVFHRLSSYVAKYRIHPDAKCFSDNYGSRIELIDVSRNYWPSKWNLEYWSLTFQYLFSYGAITRRYADSERLLNSALNNLDHHQRRQAISDFVLAHFKHFATPMLPGYKTVLKRILEYGIGPLWFWRFAKRVLYSLSLRKKVSLSATKNVSESGMTIAFNTKTIGYRKPQFKYWAKSGEEFTILRDWSPESTYVHTDNLNGVSDVVVHVRSGNKGDWQNQAWVKNEWQNDL